MFKRYVARVFTLEFKEEPDSSALLDILMQMNYSYDKFQWHFPVDIEGLDMSWRLRNNYKSELLLQDPAMLSSNWY